MSNIYIFSGTTEGRELSEFLCKNEIRNTVFVATEYGKIVMEENPLCTINQGRLDEEQMISLFNEDKPKTVVDATHPYAVEVSKNIKEACEKTNTEYIRISRDLPLTEELLKEDYPDIDVVLSTDEAIEYLKKTSGNILLTTGVKTLKEYAAVPELRERIYARILPSKESMELAYSANLEPRQIIAMEGPFLTAMNEATIKQYNIKILVTKNSGIKGGFIEKLEAATNQNTKALVIDFQKVKEGISLEAAKNVLIGISHMKIADPFESPKKQISIVGIGAGNETTMTVAARRAIKDASLIIGADRMIEVGKTINDEAECIIEYMPEKVLDIIDKSEDLKIAFLVSGDTGFFSGATNVKEVLKNRDYIVKVFPGISSIAYFASLIGFSYSEAAIISAHGRECDVMDALTNNKKVFAIVSGFEDVNAIAEDAAKLEEKSKIYVGFNLGCDDETITDFVAGEPVVFNKKGLYVVGVIKYE